MLWEALVSAPWSQLRAVTSPHPLAPAPQGSPHVLCGIRVQAVSSPTTLLGAHRHLPEPALRGLRGASRAGPGLAAPLYTQLCLLITSAGAGCVPRVRGSWVPMRVWSVWRHCALASRSWGRGEHPQSPEQPPQRYCRMSVGLQQEPRLGARFPVRQRDRE